MSKLHVKAKGASGRVINVTPESAGWTYVGFDLHRLAPGAPRARSGQEATWDLCVAGSATISLKPVVTQLIPISLDQQLAATWAISALSLHIVHIAHIDILEPGSLGDLIGFDQFFRGRTTVFAHPEVGMEGGKVYRHLVADVL